MTISLFCLCYNFRFPVPVENGEAATEITHWQIADVSQSVTIDVWENLLFLD